MPRLLLRIALAGTALPTSGFAQQTLQYNASQLNCARFLETVQASILTASAGRVREQTTGRTAVWQFRAEPAIQQIKLEGWLDSLELWRKSNEGTIRPDTDGLLGGRYRGLLSGAGSFQRQVTPFVPEEVAEVADMGRALDDFFPPLPQAAIRPGQAWTDSSGLTVRRLADSSMSGVALYRFELESRHRSRSARTSGDSAGLSLRQVAVERGRFVWHPLVGLLSRERRIVVETAVPAGRTIRQPVNARIEQRITVVRDLSAPRSESGRCPASS